jgi:hypothetical protein
LLSEIGIITTKTGRHDIAEILLKVVLNTKNQSIKPYTHANTKGGQRPMMELVEIHFE